MIHKSIDTNEFGIITKVETVPEDISVQILSQASENIQKLFDQSTRIDERMKTIQDRQHDFEDQLDNVISQHTEIMQKIAVLESKNGDALEEAIDKCRDKFAELDKRLIVLEGTTDRNQDRWNKTLTFIIQLVWVLLASWLLLKMNIQSPAIP